ATLAFAVPRVDNVVGIYDVATKATQRVDMARLVGPGYHLGDAGSLLAWVSDTLLVAIPAGEATTFAFGRSAADGSSTQKAVVIDLAHANSAHEVHISLSGGSMDSGPGPSPGMLLVATDKAIDRFTVTSTSITSAGSVPVPTSALVQAISPDGSKAL